MISIGPHGLVIDSFDVILSEIQDDFRGAFGSGIATNLDSSAGQLQRVWATREEKAHQAVQQLYSALDPRTAEGVHLDQRNSLLGITREPARPAQVLGTVTGTPATFIPNGNVVEVAGFRFQIAEGPDAGGTGYTIPGAGTLSNVRVIAEEDGPVDVAVLGAWTIVTTVLGWDTFDDDSQPDFGRNVETDAEFRVRGDVERYRRGQGPLLAIDSAVSEIDAVEYVRTWHNITVDPVDANGIPLHAINSVVKGGEDEEVAQAIWNSGPAGHIFFGLPGPTFVSVDVVISTEPPQTVNVQFNRVEDIDIWMEVTLTTSTSEEIPPDDLEASVQQAIFDYTVANWDIGTDVLPKDIEGAIAEIPGFDDARAEVSTSGGGPFDRVKIPVSIRQQARTVIANITVLEN